MKGPPAIHIRYHAESRNLGRTQTEPPPREALLSLLLLLLPRPRPSPYLLLVNELCCIISPSRFSAQRAAPLPPSSVRPSVLSSPPSYLSISSPSRQSSSGCECQKQRGRRRRRNKYSYTCRPSSDAAQTPKTPTKTILPFSTLFRDRLQSVTISPVMTRRRAITSHSTSAEAECNSKRIPLQDYTQLL